MPVFGCVGRVKADRLRALGSAGLPEAMPASELAAGLRALVAEGVVRHGAALAFAGHADHTPAPRSGAPDLTGWECATSSFHWMMWSRSRSNRWRMASR